MADASLQIGNGNWAVKPSLLLGYNVVSNLYNPIEVDVTRATLGTRTNQAGIIDIKDNNIARINYESGVGSLLLEPQRINLSTNSGTLTGFGTFGISLSSALSNNPENGINSVLMTENTDNSAHFTFGPSVINYTIGILYTNSIFVKKGNGSNAPNIVQLTFNSVAFGTSQYANFNILTGVITAQVGGTATITSYPNGWYRISFSAQCTVTSTNASGVTLFFTNNNPTATRGSIYVGNVNSNVFVWGAQLEQGAYPTSYIPTTTTALIRNADVSSKTGISDLIGQTEGVLFIESSALFNDLTSRVISISDGTNNNRIFLGYNSVTQQIVFSVVSGGNVIISGIAYNVTDETQFAKIAVRYSNTLGYSLWVNGASRGISALTTLPIVMNRFGFDSGAGGGGFYYAKVKQVQLYKTYLTNAEMAALTTL